MPNVATLRPKTDPCPSCGHRKHSATRNPDGMCDECNGGVYLRKRLSEDGRRRQPQDAEDSIKYSAFPIADEL